MEQSHRGNYRKTWGDYHGIKIPEGWVVHHILPRSEGGNHCISNLLACPKKAHLKFHRLRGDRISSNFILMANTKGWNKGMTKHTSNSVAKMAQTKTGARPTDAMLEGYKRISETLTGRRLPAGHKSKLVGESRTLAQRTGDINGSYAQSNKTVYLWEHKEGYIEFGRVRDMINKYSGNFDKLARKERNSCLGWINAEEVYTPIAKPRYPGFPGIYG